MRIVRVALSSLLGALAALVAGYVASYVLTHFGLGVIGTCGKFRGPIVFSQAALNFYAMQHIELAGSRGSVAASITIPVSLWVLVPAIALAIGGYIASSSVGSLGRFVMSTTAVCTGLVYATILSIAARAVSARIDSFLMPEISGFGSNPPDFAFRPDAASTLLHAAILGVICAYLGGLVAERKQVHSEALPGKWWACAKSVAIGALIVQLTMVSSWAVYVNRSGRESLRASKDSDGLSIIELVPTAVGLGYAAIHGATITAGVESGTSEPKPFYAQANWYLGVIRNDATTKSCRKLPWAVIVGGAVLGAIGAILMGGLAVLWGSRDGSLPTALRIGFIHTTYLVLIGMFCEAVLTSRDPISASRVFVTSGFGVWLLYSLGGTSACSLLGASWSCRIRSGV